MSDGAAHTLAIHDLGGRGRMRFVFSFAFCEYANSHEEEINPHEERIDFHMKKDAAAAHVTGTETGTRGLQSRGRRKTPRQRNGQRNGQRGRRIQRWRTSEESWDLISMRMQTAMAPAKQKQDAYVITVVQVV